MDITSSFCPGCSDSDEIRYLMQNNMQITGKWSRSKPGVEFDIAYVCFSKTEVVISQPPIEICLRNFGLLIDFDILKAVTSTNTKPEVAFSGRGRHVEK